MINFIHVAVELDKSIYVYNLIKPFILRKVKYVVVISINYWTNSLFNLINVYQKGSFRNQYSINR